ncbi:MAG: CARDB domain-containing protein, partial [Verrucomicrobiaceae bacterium]
YNPASAALHITDQQKPDLIVQFITPPTGAETDSWINVPVRLSNQGADTATGLFTQRFYLSSNDEIGNDTLLGQSDFVDNLPGGSSIDQTLPMKLPRDAGRYWLVVQTDVNSTVDEVMEDNNTSIAITPLDVEPAYTTTLSIAPTTVPTNTTIPITGTATLRAGGPAKFVLVNIHITNRGVERVISALTNSVGQYSASFTPLPGEGGLMQFGAAHPGLATAPVQDEVSVYGLKAEPSTISLSLAESTTTTGSLTLSNLANLSVTGLTATLSGLPAGVQFTPTFAANTLASAGTVALNYSLTTQGPLARTTFTLSITSTEGAAVDVPVSLTVVSNTPRLVVDPAQLNAGMLRGQQQVVNFNLRNDGKAATGPVNLLLPNGVAWMQSATALPIPTIAPGASVPVNLTLTPPAALALGNHSGTIIATDGTTSLTIPFTFRALSDQLGQLLVRVEDEFTYYATGNPPLSGATVRVTDAVSGDVIGTQTTGVSGTVDFGSLREGYYNLEVTADKHSSYRSAYLVQPGNTNTVVAFISRQTVTYTWTVVPTEIEDHYKVTIDTTFETNVPLPVVTVEPAVIDLDEVAGDETTINLKITNHGLIAANGMQIGVPTHPAWTFSPLISSIGALPAGASISVPMTIRRASAAVAPASLRGSLDSLVPETRSASAAGGGPCTVTATVCWYLECGSLHNTYCAQVTVNNAANGCGQPAPGDGFCTTCGGPGGAGGATGTYHQPNVVENTTTCDPCDLKRLLAVAECALEFIPLPLPDDVKDAYDCLSDAADCADSLTQGGVTRASAYGCATAGLGCAGKAGKLLKFLAILECTCNILTACRDVPGHNPSDIESGAATACDFVGMTSSGASMSRSARAAAIAAQFASTPELIPLFTQARRLRAVADFRAYLLGSLEWMRIRQGEEATALAWLAAFELAAKATSDEAGLISTSERNSLLALALPSNISSAMATKQIDRWNRSISYWDAGVFTAANVPVGSSTDFIDMETFHALAIAAKQALAESKQAGYDSLENGVAAEIQKLRTFYLSQPATGGVCARVKLRLEQDAVITRDAFRATLELNNSGATPLSNVRVDVAIRPKSGGAANALFSVRLESASVMSAVDGTGSLAANATGTARWLIIPSVDAAPTGPTEYLVGGTLSYRVDGLDVSLPLYEAPITVMPCPRLTLKYFHQRDVFSDDPFTLPIEPAIPYSLAVMI